MDEKMKKVVKTDKAYLWCFLIICAVVFAFGVAWYVERSGLFAKGNSIMLSASRKVYYSLVGYFLHYMVHMTVILVVLIVPLLLYYKKYKGIGLFLAILGGFDLVLSLVDYPTCECVFNIVPLFVPLFYATPIVFIFSLVKAVKRYLKKGETEKDFYSFILAFLGVLIIALISSYFAHGQPVLVHFKKDTFTPNYSQETAW